MSTLIKLHQLDGYIQSIYLAEHHHGLLLLDGCSRADVDKVCKFITEELNRSLNDLKLVVVTHMHPDHAGGAVKLRELSGCQIAIANVPGDWYQGVDGVLMHWSDLLLAKWVAKRKGQPAKNIWYNRTLKADVMLSDEEPLPGFTEWKALFTQGHTDRDLSLYHAPTHRVYVADLMVTVKGRYIPPFPIFYPNRYKASVDKIVQLKPRSVWLAHGGEIELTEEVIAHLRARSPNRPITHWRSVKAKVRRAIFKKTA